MEQIVFNAALQLPVFLFAIVVHEWGHARMAYYYGDDTADRMGRMTLNPTAHVDMFGTIIFPLILLMIGSTVFGWAKPVPVATRNLRDPKNGIFWVSFAGPLMNIIVGTVSALVWALMRAYAYPFTDSTFAIAQMVQFSIVINFILAFFNLIPLHPLDGSKMLPRFLPVNWQLKYAQIADYGTYIFFGLILLSYMGVPIFQVLLYPAYVLAQFLPALFFSIFG